MTTAPIDTWAPGHPVDTTNWAAAGATYSGATAHYAIADEEMAEAAREFGPEALAWAEATTEAVAESWPTE